MILATTGHRPSEALFEITLADIDLISGAALFRDKRHDVAHDPRLVCLPRVVVKQVKAYLRHLSGLVQQMPSLAGVLREVQQGSLPLLFDLSQSVGMVRPKFADLVRRSPKEWKQVAWNWSRTYIRTYGIEMGTPPFLIAAQLGHFDAVGYPYSNQSPTEPLDVVKQIQPWLDQLAKRQGWSVLESEAPSESTITDFPPPQAIQDWGSNIANAKDVAERTFRMWERRLKVERHKLRTEAREAILRHPRLVESGAAAAHGDPLMRVGSEMICSIDLDAVRDDLVLACGEDAIAAAARIRELNGVVGRLAKRAGCPAPAAAVPVAVRRPLDNPFFQGSCLALTQVQALRRHVQDRSRLPRPRRTFRLQVARAAEALAIFGGLEDAATVLAVLEARGHASPSAKIVDLLLVPLPDGRCVALRGIAALALACLASEFPKESLPVQTDLEDTLATLLPLWAIDDSQGSTGLLDRLCSTLAVSNRFEYSPAARFALDPERGSVQATIEEQIAFIDRDPVGPRRMGQPSGDSADPARPDRDVDADAAKNQRCASARRQYAGLLKLIPKPRKTLELTLTAVTIPATVVKTAATREYVKAELTAWLGSSDGQGLLWPIVRMLGEWVLSELGRKGEGGQRLADSTVVTYLTRIGAALVRELGELDLGQWDERLLEDAYEYALDASTDSKHKVASALLSFHRFCEKRFDLPEADLSGVYAALGDHKRHVDVAIILPVERDMALKGLGSRAWVISTDASTARRARLAQFVATCLGDTGVRISEPLGFRVDDLGLRPSGQVWGIVRPNLMRRLKTRSGRRSITFDSTKPNGGNHIWSWRESVRRHAPLGRAAGAYLTAELEDPRAFGEHHVVCSMIRAELAHATGRPTERLHRLRHLKALEEITAVALSSEDAVAVGLEPFAGGRVLKPRDFAAISAPLGHSHWMTTIQCYLHVPAVLQSRAASSLSREYFGRQAVAGALGYTTAFLDNLMRERDGAGQKVAWFNRFRPSRIQPGSGVLGTMPEHRAWEWTARRVAELLARSERCKDLESTVRLVGAPLEAAPALTKCAARWERKLGRRLLPSTGTSPGVAPRKALRRLEGDAAIEVLWDRFDGGNSQFRADIVSLVNAFYAELQRGPAEVVTLPAPSAESLKQILMQEGVGTNKIRVETDHYGMSEMTVLRRLELDNDGRVARLGLKRVLVVIGMAATLQNLKAYGIE